MKRTELTKRDKSNIRNWLMLDNNDKQRNCPFIKRKDDNYRRFDSRFCKICCEYFPLLQKKDNWDSHPCSIYAHSTVIRRAKEMIK